MPYVHDEIAKRAFDLYDFRREHGLPGDPGSDWLNAERGITTVHFVRVRREFFHSGDPNRPGVWRVLKAAAARCRRERRTEAG